MSHLFCALLFHKDRFGDNLVVDALGDAEAEVPGESFWAVDASPTVRAVYYNPGRWPTKNDGFEYSVEFFFDGFLRSLKEAARNRSRHQFVGLVYSDMDSYRWTELHGEKRFEGRFIAEDSGESITVREGQVLQYAFEKARQQHPDAQWASFDPLRLIANELGIGIAEILEGLYRAEDGTRLWPTEPIPGDEPAQVQGSAIVPMPPMWDWLRDELAGSAPE